ncbi:DMT family transporter [Candidatus Nitrosacidococcus sp. I8]|uniref:DMT family transporter n=1 Tax=Candidatus Nitrosacidococcus sp. I8 TaxID=2942908 RepID=UPI002226482C|nr:DMT family transporter [Candidatus Nitrosacidococcus sp. I8]CAH9016708.1 putative cystine transporter YijE [Candidatus Nitrosacidococcus sp. I8]
MNLSLSNIRKIPNQVSSILALVVLTFIWGYGWVVVKQALIWCAPVEFAALRSIVGGLFLFLILFLKKNTLKPVHIKPMLWLSLLQTVGFMGSGALALVEGSVGKSAVLVYTMPLWAIIFAAHFLKEPIYKLQWLALGIAGIGLIGIIDPWETHFTLVSTLLALIAGLLWGVSVIISKEIKLNNTAELININAWQMFIGGLALETFSYFIGESIPIWSSAFLWALAYNSILSSALGWILWLYALQHLSASITSLSSLGVPVITIILAGMILNEIPTLPETVGVILILISLAILSIASSLRH